MRLWRRSASPEPAAAQSAAAGARYASPQDRLKGDLQETARQRLVIASALFAVAFAAVGLRMGYVSLLRDGAEPTQRVAARGGSIQSERADIVDRNGAVLATSVPVMSAFVNPHLVIDPPDAARKIVTALPDLKYEDIREKLEADKTFFWIKRGLSPREHDRVNRLGIPGLDFQAEERRIYPQGTAAAHILGYASVDNSGLAGVERYFDQQLQSGETVQLSIDLRLQRMVERELARGIHKFSAIGGTAIVMDATNGEILAMASLPTFNPNSTKTLTNEALFNRATLGVYEQGSTFKIFNTAMALDSGKVTVASVFDATSPIRIDRFTINDDHAQRRPLNVAEIFRYSSNIGSAKMAVEVMGPEGQRAFLDKIGFLRPLNTQLPELAAPLWPRHWMRINTMTIAFGHGISVTPLHLVTGSAAMVNGGILYPPSLVKRTEASDKGRRVIQTKTSVSMRQLLRLNAVEGTGRNANLPGYEVGGKTGTAEKPGRGGYRQKALISSFVGMFPMNDPKFVILYSLDEPKGLPETGGYATAGWVAAPSVKVIVENIASLYGILPGDLKEGLPPIEIASTPVPATVAPQPQLMPVSARRSPGDHRKALPVRPAPGQTAAAPDPGVRGPGARGVASE
ncbi:peptidoglycan D,D-transpeptidase FtsI family protein [Reyranella massiliensis]|uniref:peptidoglycan D,D-transpeptidase FtsI family protein n=1 Tax=Reyranella massiliensis TaxID=445220 RepID=UPI0002F2651D|nr:penicillin-binding protein 2 [Reyranella massiliensis]